MEMIKKIKTDENIEWDHVKKEREKVNKLLKQISTEITHLKNVISAGATN